MSRNKLRGGTVLLVLYWLTILSWNHLSSRRIYFNQSSVLVSSKCYIATWIGWEWGTITAEEFGQYLSNVTRIGSRNSKDDESLSICLTSTIYFISSVLAECLISALALNEVLRREVLTRYSVYSDNFCLNASKDAQRVSI